MKKKYLVGGLLMGAAAVSHAQTAGSGVTIYGIYDAGVEYVSGAATTPGKNGAKGSWWGMPSNTGEFASRLGFRGIEDLGGGLSTVWTMEAGFTPDAGTSGQGGRLFGRQAFVGLAGKDWGQLTFGRQWTMAFWGLLDTDILASNVFGSGSIDSYFPNAREDNSIEYRGKFGNLALGASYSFGRDTLTAGPNNTGTPPANGCAGEVANDFSACKAFSAMVKYDTESWGLSGVVDRLNGGANSANTAGAVPNTAYYGLGRGMHDTRYIASGWMKFNALKVSAGAQFRHNDGTYNASPTAPVQLSGAVTNKTGLNSNLYWLQAAYSFTPSFVLDGGWFHNQIKNCSQCNSNLFAVRGTYSMSKRTKLYGTVGYIKNQDNVSASVDGAVGSLLPNYGGSQTGAMVGILHYF